MNDLDLAALRSGPDVQLASVSDVKARGDQRRQRGRVALAGAAALVLLAGAGTAVALAGNGKPDALIPAGPTPTPSSASVPATPAPRGLAALVLQPEDGSRIEGGVWERRPYPRDDAFAHLMVCKQADVHGERGFWTSLSPTVKEFSGVSTQVLEYASADAARRAHAAVLTDVARCPQRPDDSETGKATVSSSVFALADGAIGVRQVSRDCGTCAAHASDWAVVTVGRYVGYVLLDWNRREYLQAWANALTARLAAAAH